MNDVSRNAKAYVMGADVLERLLDTLSYAPVKVPPGVCGALVGV